MYVYKVTNMVNGKVYVGRTKDYAGRVKYHKTRYVAQKEYNKPLCVAMRKYGVENFKFDIIASGLDDDESNKLETKMIKDLHSLVGEMDIMFPRVITTTVFVAQMLIQTSLRKKKHRI